MASWSLLFNQKDLKDQGYMGCEKREAGEPSLLTTIDRSIDRLYKCIWTFTSYTIARDRADQSNSECYRRQQGDK
jgi:hypothetical protein